MINTEKEIPEQIKFNKRMMPIFRRGSGPMGIKRTNSQNAESNIGADLERWIEERNGIFRRDSREEPSPIIQCHDTEKAGTGKSVKLESLDLQDENTKITKGKLKELYI